MLNWLTVFTVFNITLLACKPGFLYTELQSYHIKLSKIVWICMIYITYIFLERAFNTFAFSPMFFFFPNSSIWNYRIHRTLITAPVLYLMESPKKQKKQQHQQKKTISNLRNTFQTFESSKYRSQILEIENLPTKRKNEKNLKMIISIIQIII